MMVYKKDSLKHLFWVSDAPIKETLHCITWLSTSNELMKLGWKVSLISPGERGWQNISGVPVYGIPMVEIYLLRRIFYQIRVIVFMLKQFKQLDVVLFNELSAPGMLAVRNLLKLFTKKRPIFIMDSRSLLMQRDDKIKLKDRVREFFLKTMNWTANRYLDGRTAITKPMVQVLQIPKNKLVAIWPSAVDVNLFEKALQERVWETDPQVIELIYIGCMHFERNLMNLSRAVLHANQNQHRFNLTLLGDGNEFDDLLNFSKSTDGTIKVLPPVSHISVPGWLAKAQVGVLPFPDEERFRVSSPIKLFEYMAAGLVVFATKIEAHTQVIGTQPFGLWSEGADIQSLTNGLDLVWDKRFELQKLGELSRQYSDNFTWKSSAKLLSEGLVNVLNQRKNPEGIQK